MTPTAPPTGGPVPPPSAVDPVTLGLGQALVDAIVAGDNDRLEAARRPCPAAREFTG